MTRHERLTVTVSSLALVVSVLSPVITYRWLNPKEIELRYAPRIHASIIEWINAPTKDVQIEVRNEGRTPSKDIRVLVRRSFDEVSLPPIENVTITPPSPVKSTMNDREMNLVIERALGAGETLQIKINDIKIPARRRLTGVVDVRVYSESGEARTYASKYVGRYTSGEGF